MGVPEGGPHLGCGRGCSPSRPAALPFRLGRAVHEDWPPPADFPDSRPAVEDLKYCLERTDQRQQLLVSLKAALETRLLHPGAAATSTPEPRPRSPGPAAGPGAVTTYKQCEGSFWGWPGDGVLHRPLTHAAWLGGGQIWGSSGETSCEWRWEGLLPA